MNRLLKLMLIVGLTTVFFVGCKSLSAHTEKADFQHPGALWLSWSLQERNNFANVYIQGYETGMYQACKAVNDLSLQDDLNSKGPDYKPHQFHYERCRAGVGEYTKYKMSPSTEPDFSPYTDIITAFYTQHPEYRNIPFVYLMQFLTDKENKTTEELFSMAKAGKMRTNW
jgi:hypothetical protein